MDVAVMVDGQEDVSWAQWCALAAACEAGGYQALFAADHYGSVYEPARCALDAWGVVTGLSARTSRIRLGVLVSPPTFRHPSVLARLAVTADHISGGRTELAMGIGWNEPEHARLGLPFPDTATRTQLLEEQVEIISRQWSEDRFDFDGQHYRLAGCEAWPKPLQRPRLPIIIGGSARPRTVALAARFADEYNTTFGATPAACRERRGRLDAACARIGRDPRTLRLSAMVEFVLAETPGAGRRAAHRDRGPAGARQRRRIPGHRRRGRRIDAGRHPRHGAAAAARVRGRRGRPDRAPAPAP